MMSRDSTPITSNVKRLKRLEVAIGSLLLTLDKCLLLCNIFIHRSSYLFKCFDRSNFTLLGGTVKNQQALYQKHLFKA